MASSLVILLADDNRLLLSTLSMLLRAEGHEVLAADSGARALSLASHRRPDAAIIDLHMPVVSGSEVAACFRSMQIPFVFLSAYDEFDVRVAAHTYGAKGYLLKPAGVEEINAALARCVEPAASAPR